MKVDCNGYITLFSITIVDILYRLMGLGQFDISIQDTQVARGRAQNAAR